MPKSTPSPLFPDLSLDAAAAVTGLSERTIRLKIATGALSAYKVGRSLAIPADALNRFIEARRVPVVPKGAA